MGKRTRRGAMLFTSVAGTLAITAIAWACTPNMSGLLWLCTAATSPDSGCTISYSSRATSLGDGTTAYVQASGLTSSTGYNVRHQKWPADAGPLSNDGMTGEGGAYDAACHEGTKFINKTPNPDSDVFSTTSVGGNLSDQEIQLPSGSSAEGTYSICATPVAADTPVKRQVGTGGSGPGGTGADGLKFSQHGWITVT